MLVFNLLLGAFGGVMGFVFDGDDGDLFEISGCFGLWFFLIFVFVREWCWGDCSAVVGGCWLVIFLIFLREHDYR